jgi:hypothetical protein
MLTTNGSTVRALLREARRDGRDQTRRILHAYDATNSSTRPLIDERDASHVSSMKPPSSDSRRHRHPLVGVHRDDHRIEDCCSKEQAHLSLAGGKE